MISDSLRENLYKKAVDEIFSSGTGEFEEEEVYEKIPLDLKISREKAKKIVHDLAQTRSSNSLIQAVRQRNTPGLAKEYKPVSWHGTTVLLVQLPTELLVAVDSLVSATYEANDKKEENKDYEGLMSLVEEKFVRISGNIHATLVGAGDRCQQMIQYVRKNMFNLMVHGGVPTLDDVSVAASRYFTEFPRDPTKHKSVVFICGWNPVQQRHVVMQVGDELPMLQVDCRVFGAGWGAEPAVLNLAALETPIDVDVLKETMLKISLEHHPTGGVIKVFSLKNETCELKSQGTVFNELDNHDFANILFDDKSMFVIILKDHEYILSRADLKDHLKRWDKQSHVFWLCYVDELFLVYRAVFKSLSARKKWANTCKLFARSIRRGTYKKSIYACHYYVCDAAREKIDFIRGDMVKEDFWKYSLTVRTCQDAGSSSGST